MNAKIESIVNELLKNTHDDYFREVLTFDINNPRQADPVAHTCDADTIAVCQMIANDGFDITGFGLTQTPSPKVYCFSNRTTRQQFDVACVLPRDNPQWSFTYVNNYVGEKHNYFLADSIQEAVEKYAE